MINNMVSLKIFHQFCDNRKILSCTFHLKEDEMKIAMFAHFKEYHGNHNAIIIHKSKPNTKLPNEIPMTAPLLFDSPISLHCSSERNKNTNN